MGHGRMVGRERELATLRVAADRTAEGGRVEAVVILGEAGMGKTRLALELVHSLDDASWLHLASHGVPLDDRAVPFGGATELVRGLVRAFGAAEVRRRSGREAAVLGFLLPSVAEPPSRAVARAEVMAAVLTLLEGLDRPVCWLLDDAQWLDGATCDLLLYLERVMEGPLLLLATARTAPTAPGELPEGLVELGRRAEVVQLGPLSRREVAAQVAGLTDEPLSDEVVRRICELSDGLPFFVEQLVSEGGQVSGSMRTVLRARLDRLSAPARRLLAAAAVGEGLLSPSHLRAVSGLGSALDRTLEEVRENGILLPDDGGEVLRFHHGLLSDAVAGDLLAEERIAWHQAWADHLDHVTSAGVRDLRVVMERARHHEAVGGPAAFTAALAAARAAESAQDDQARRRWWEKVREYWPDTAPHDVELTRDAALSRLIAALWSVGAVEPLERILDEELNGEEDWLRSLWLRLLRFQVRRAKQIEYVRLLPPSEAPATIARLRSLPPDFKVAEVMMRVADEWLQDMPDLSGELLRHVVNDLAQDTDPDVVADAWNLLGWLETCRGNPDAHAELERQHVEWMVRHYPAGVLNARCRWALGLLQAGRYQQAIQLVDQNLADIRDPVLHPHLWLQQHMFRAVSHLHLGEWEATRTDLERATEGAVGGDVASWWNTIAGLLSARIGDLKAAQACLAEIPEPPPSTPKGMRWSQQAIQRALIQLDIAAAQEDPVAVRRHTQRLVALHHTGDPPEELAEAFTTGLRSGADRHAQDADSLALIAKVVAFLDAAQPWPGRALQAELAEMGLHLRRMRDTDSSAAWAEVVGHWSDLGRPYDTAYCELFQSECALRDGDREIARTVLTKAHATARRMGAHPLSQRIEKAARRGRLSIGQATPAVPGLTSREVEVLALLVGGQTNPEIAAELAMSPKTVSVHVSHIIAKLGVANRTEAATRAVRENLLVEH